MRLTLLAASMLLLSSPSFAQSGGSISVTSLADSGIGSLREAIVSANSDGADSTITFGVSGTIRLTSTLPAIANDGTLLIIGPQSGFFPVTQGITISGDANNSGVNDSGDVPLFTVNMGANVTLNNLILNGGRAANLTSTESSSGGAIHNEGTLTVTGCTLSNNFALNFGGAIRNTGSLTVMYSTLALNASNFSGGGINNEGTLMVIGSTLVNNSTLRSGGAIRNYALKTATIINSTLVRNRVLGVGQNEASRDGVGGAIYNEGVLTLSSSTLTGNIASRYATIYNAQNDGLYEPSGTIALSNNLFIGLEGLFYGLPTNPIATGDANKNFWFRSYRPWLGELADNGGPTQTIALLAGSPVINKGDPTDAPPYDQRGLGFSRIQGGALDIGAYESPFATAPTDITLSNAVVIDNAPSGTTVGTFSTADTSAVDAHTYSLVSGEGSADNASFVIDGNALKMTQTFRYAIKNEYSIRVQTSDSEGFSFQKRFVISVSNVNLAPTEIRLSNSSVEENQPVGTTVGDFSTSDANVGDAHTYSLVSGVGSSDNAAFSIDGNLLKTAARFDYETKNVYSIRVQTRDAGGFTFQNVFSINVRNIYDEVPSLVVTTLADVFAEDGVTSHSLRQQRRREQRHHLQRERPDSFIEYSTYTCRQRHAFNHRPAGWNHDIRRHQQPLDY